MKKSMLMVLLLAVISPMVLLAGGGSTTYDYSATLNVKSSGNGKVYASTSDATQGTSASATKNEPSEEKSKSITLYAHAVADDGYEFSKWSDGTTGNPQAVSISLTSSSTSATKELTATFVKKALPEFSVTFSVPIGGEYTVNGTQVSSAYSLPRTEILETTLVATPSAGNRFYGWYTLNGSTKEYFSYSASVSKSFTSSATVGVDFISESDVAKVATFAEAYAAMSSDAKIVEITSGTTLIVPSGSTLTVPAGKMLSVEGKLAVAGSFAVNGLVSGNGTLYKVSKIITQGEIITPRTANGNDCGNLKLSSHTDKVAKYRKTTVSAVTPSITGTVNLKTSWAALCNGNVYAMTVQSPKAINVNFNSATAVNDINSLVENGDVNSTSLSTDNNWILFEDCSLSGPVKESIRLNYQKITDLAGKTLSMGVSRTYSSFQGVFLNGVISFSPGTDFQNAPAAFFNCSSVTIKKIKGSSTALYFYDCGTASTPAKLTFTYTSGGTRPAHFYSGYYDYAFSSSTDSGLANVYGGSFTKDPSAYIPAALSGDAQNPHAAIYDGSKYYVVQVVKPAVMTVSVGGKEYETLDEAFAAATDGATVSLIAGVDLTGKTVTNTKNITLDLGRSQIAGGKIINNGTMLITDVSSDNESIVGCDIENNGTLDFVFGTYNGAITCKAGTLTVHNGKFNGVFSREDGTVDLKGGNFKTDISGLITAGGYKVFTKDSYYCPCEMPDGEFVATTLSGLAGYSVTPYVSSDFALLRRHAQGESSRADYKTTSDWARVAELLTTYHALYSYGLDPTLIFDRPVTKGSLELSVSSGSTPQSSDFYISVEKDQPYRALTEFLMHGAPFGPYSAKTYRDIVTEEIGTVAVSVADGSSGMNAGTVCTLQIELWQRDRAPDYSSTGRYVTNTVDVLGETRFTIGAGSNKAMIRPETGAATFYAKLADAVTASNGGTVLLAADSTEAETITLPAVGTYIIDPYGFAYANKTVVVAKGLELESALETDSAYAASQQKAVVYTVRKKSGLSGAGTEADPFLIKELDDLVLFRDSVNAGEPKYNAEGVWVVLGADIDMSSVDWSVNIGDAADTSFDGIFDGKGKKILNLNSVETAKDPWGYICTGLFGCIAGNAQIKNLTLENVNITAEYTGNNVAALVGFAYNCSGAIDNVTVTNVAINAANATGVGAIVGYDYYSPALKVTNCTVDGTSINGAAYVGGVIGYASTKIALNNNTVKNLTLNGTASVGGVAGIMLAGGSASGNTVEKVLLSATGEMWANSIGLVAGTITTGSVTVTGTTATDCAVTDLIGGILVEKPTSPIEKIQVQIGDSYFTTLDAAINAAKAGDTIKLLTNVGTDAALVINKELTVDLNGKTIAATENDKVGDGVFCVVAGGDLTINDSVGTGVINGVGDNDYNIAIWANGGKVIINGGNFTNVGAADKTDPNAHFDLIYAKNGGEVIINGGSFECETPEFTLNSHDTYKGNITVNGGTFVGFDPRNNAVETAGTTFMAAGKYTFAEGGNYIVVTPEDYILNGVSSGSATVNEIDSLLAGAVTVTKDGEKYVATATYTFKVTAVDTVNPEKSSYELTGGTLRPGKTAAVKYIDLATGAESWDKPASCTVTFKLVIK